MSNHIDSIIEEAKAQAARATAGAVVSQTSSIPAIVPAGKVRTLADAIASAGLSVDIYFQVDEHGLSLDKELIAGDTFDAELCLSDLKYPFAVRYNTAGTVNFLKSYDGIRESKSRRSWAEVVAQSMAIDAGCRGQYDSVELLLTLTSDVKLKNGKTIPSGTRIGHQTSVTGTKSVMDWIIKTATERGEAATVNVRIGAVRQVKGTSKFGHLVITTIAN